MNGLLKFMEKGARWFYLHGWQYRTIGGVHERRVAEVSSRGRCRVVFIAMNRVMWRYQHLLELIDGDDRFEVKVVLSPCLNLSVEQQHTDMEGLRKYFKEKGVEFVDYDFEATPYDFGTDFDPDLVFYPQPYEHLLVPAHDCLSHYNRLLCYYPYAYMTGKGKFFYDFHFHNLAWRLYYSNDTILEEARKTAWNHGRNVRIVGYPNADDFFKPEFRQVWKRIDEGRERKRLIWAPHFSLGDTFGLVGHGGFIWMSFFMLDLAQRYKEHLQIAFKPHPRLLSELYKHPDWGKERADAYYRQWAEMENTQLETGDHVDLFMTSDAMVHDSGSFVVEYMFTHKPVMYAMRNLDRYLASQTEFSREAIGLHYHGANEREVMDFIDFTVLGGEDPLAEKREGFYNRYLKPIGGKTVAQNTLDDLVASLRLPDRNE